MKYKPGWKSSEFWFTLVSFIFSGLYLTGIINDNQNKEELISIVSHAVESCILIGGQFIILYNYINTRKNIKQTIVPDVVENVKEIKDEPKVKQPRKSTNKTSKPRSSKPRNRKTDRSN